MARMEKLIELRSSIGMEKLAGYVFEGDDGFSPGFGVEVFEVQMSPFSPGSWRLYSELWICRGSRVQNSLGLFALVKSVECGLLMELSTRSLSHAGSSVSV